MNQTKNENNRWEVLKEVIKNRHSTRSFTDKNISDKDINDLIEAGIYAPSGSNAQNQRFLIIKDKKIIEDFAAIRWVWPYLGSRFKKLREKLHYGLIGKANVVIVVFADSRFTRQSSQSSLYYVWEELEIQNCSASIQNILLAASAKKIGSCWISLNNRMTYTRLISKKSIREIFPNYRLPNFYKPQGIIALGYPKSYTENGYPAGEPRHGTTPYSTKRKPIDNYIIDFQKLPKNGNLNFVDHVILKFISFLSSRLTKIIHFLQSKAASIEAKLIKFY